jgi:hypothetical protein
MEDEEVEVLFIEGVEIAVRSGLKAKRRLLARVVAKAVLDDAEIEPAQLLVQAFRDLDAPHLRALVRIRNAEKTRPRTVVTWRLVAISPDGKRSRGRGCAAVAAWAATW